LIMSANIFSFSLLRGVDFLDITFANGLMRVVSTV